MITPTNLGMSQDMASYKRHRKKVFNNNATNNHLEEIIISYYRQLSADSKMKNHKIILSFVSLEGPRAWFNKTGISFMFFFILFV